MSDAAILVLNAGSSSLKFAMYTGRARPSADGRVCAGEFSGIGHQTQFVVCDAHHAMRASRRLPDGTTHDQALAVLLEWIGQSYPRITFSGVGHRVVHGGAKYTAPVRIDESVVADLRRLIPLAPLHQPHHLAAIAALATLQSALPQVACFDTAFHHTQSTVATSYALPAALTREGIRRYGFHGLSYEYIAGVLPDILGNRLANGRIVVAHLGSGASMCAMYRRQSVASTMGFSTLDGLPMAQRCGVLDPGVVLYLIQEKNLSAEAVSHLLHHESGMLGVSGVTDDMRVLLASSDAGAKAAVDLFVYRAAREIGSLAAALGGLDALVFTAGIGEHAAEIRARICEQSRWLGIEFDATANGDHAPCISRSGASVSAWVIPTDEDLVVARQAWDVIHRDATGADVARAD